MSYNFSVGEANEEKEEIQYPGKAIDHPLSTQDKIASLRFTSLLLCWEVKQALANVTTNPPGSAAEVIEGTTV